MKIAWPELMRFALGRLRLSPDQFWSMTVVELQAAIDGYYGVCSNTTLNRESLEEMMFEFPDQKTDMRTKNEKIISPQSRE